MRRSTVLMMVMVSGCGSSMSFEGDACPQVSGKFSAFLKLRQTTGACRTVELSRTDPMEFDQHGLISPVGDIARCTTTQVECSVDVTCTSSVIDARMDFSGTLSKDGRELEGTATLVGSYGDCSRLVYEVDATATD